MKNLTWDDREMRFEDLYKNAKGENDVEIFMIYQYGGFDWARLNTRRGVNTTINLKQVPPDILLARYEEVKNEGAKRNMKKQARKCGVDVSKWPDP